ncbi:hypothetical protein NT017_38510 [Prolixibacter sp. NT017]|nr:hypothetical protein NT017_38510 [Prolixibacter sp. NT017]
MTIMPKHSGKFLLTTLLVSILMVTGCSISYTFTGASIAPDVKTVFVDYFPNRARVVNPTLSNTFTEGLKDKFVNQTSLTLNNSQGDLEFSGEITGYDIRPLSIQQSNDGRDVASQNRLTVTVKVKFVNNKNHDQDFNSTFSAYYDWDSTRNLSDVEDAAVQDITEQLVDDIFNRSVANW